MGSHWQAVWLRVVFAALIGGFVDALLVLGGGKADAGTLLLPMAGAAVIVASGEMLLSIGSLTALAAWLPGAFVVGMSATSLVMLALTEIGGLPAQTAFLVWSAMVVAAAVASRHAWARSAGSWLDVGVTLGFALLVIFFCRELVAFFPKAASGGPLQGWSDYYIHGTVIASFGDPLAIGQGDILLAHASRPFYHYGPFMLPAALLPISGLPGLGLATAALLPIGLLAALLGAYALASEAAGKGAAMFAVLLIACAPDPSHYWVQNAFFGFHWMLFTSPGSGYALGVAAMAACCLAHGLKSGSRRATALAMLLLASLILIRVHFFMLLAPALFGMWLIASWQMSPRRKWLLFSAATLALFALALVLPAYHAGWRDMMQPQAYVQSMLQNGPDSYAQAFQRLVASLPLPLALAAGVALLLVASLGLFAPAMPLIAAAWACRRRWEALDWLPVLLCCTFALLALMAPVPPNTDVSEFKQRHFVLLYAIVGLWVVARLVQLLAGGLTLASDGRRVTACGLFLVAVSFLMLLGREADPGMPLMAYMPWARDFYAVPVRLGTAQAAAYVREHAEPGDLLIMGGGAMREDLRSPLIEIVSMAGVPAYVSRTDLLEKKGGLARTTAETRSAQVDAILNEGSWHSACIQMRTKGLRWYVESDDKRPRWDAAQRFAAFRAGRFTVYDAGPLHEAGACNTAS